MWAHPSAQGIGLFTYVAGVKTVSKNPHASFCDQVEKEVALLPIGGPRKVAPSRIRKPPNKELQDAVRAEEKIFEEQRAAAEGRGEAPKDAYTMSLDTLKQRYGTVNEPPQTTSIPSIPSRCKEKRRHSEFPSSIIDDLVKKKKRRVSFAPEVDARRHSISSVSSTGTERRGSGSTANDYDVYRDPRRQRR